MEKHIKCVKITRGTDVRASFNVPDTLETLPPRPQNIPSDSNLYQSNYPPETLHSPSSLKPLVLDDRPRRVPPIQAQDVRVGRFQQDEHDYFQRLMQQQNKGLKRVEETRKRAGELQAKLKKHQYQKYEVGANSSQKPSLNQDSPHIPENHYMHRVLEDLGRMRVERSPSPSTLLDSIERTPAKLGKNLSRKKLEPLRRIIRKGIKLEAINREQISKEGQQKLKGGPLERINPFLTRSEEQ